MIINLEVIHQCLVCSIKQESRGNTDIQPERKSVGELKSSKQDLQCLLTAMHQNEIELWKPIL